MGKKFLTSGKLMEAVNDMDNALYEMDVYEPGMFMKIADRLGEVIIMVNG